MEKDMVQWMHHMEDRINCRMFFLGAVQFNPNWNMESLRKNVDRQRNVLFEHMVSQNETYNVNHSVNVINAFTSCSLTAASPLNAKYT